MIYLLPFFVVIVGYTFVNYVYLNSKLFKVILTFSGSFLLSQVIFEMLPFAYSNNDDLKLVGLWIMIGILLQNFLEFMSKGLEHGHSHLNEKKEIFPLLSFTSICIHAFLEGIPLSRESSLTYGIMIHKLPISITLCVFLLRSNISKVWYFTLILFFSLMTPLGSFLGYSIPEFLKMPALGISIGVLLHVSTVILLESNKQHKFDRKKIIPIIAGVVFAYLID